MSAAELAREIGISQALASYHLRFLVEAGSVELAEEVSNRGGRERRYRPRVDDPADAAGTGTVAQAGHELMVTALVAELQRRQGQREVGGRELMVDAELWVTDEQWLAFRNAVGDAAQRLHEQAVMPRSPGTRPVSVSAVLFPMQRGRRGSGAPR